MSARSIDIPPLFKYSFRLFREHTSFIIGVMITYFVIGIVPQIYFFLYAPQEPTIGDQIVSIIATLVQLFIALGFIKIMLFLVDPEHTVDISDLLSNGQMFFSYVVAYFMFMIAIFVGVALFVLPGIYLYLRLQFYPYYIIEQGDPSFRALQKSWYATQAMELELFLFGICVLFINIVGLLCVGVGVIFTYPLTTMATAVVYKGLEAGAEDIPTQTYYP